MAQTWPVGKQKVKIYRIPDLKYILAEVSSDEHVIFRSTYSVFGKILKMLCRVCDTDSLVLGS